MIVVDIGNTNVVLGICIKGKINFIYRYETKSKNLFFNLNKLFKSNRKLLDVDVCVFSSVVPKLNKPFINFFKNMRISCFNINFSKVNNLFNIKQKLNNPKELGNDRLANYIAAINIYGKNCLIVDFGTATTFDIIKNHSYQGGIISPGIEISYNSLINNTAQLKKISLEKINTIVGKNTVQAMQSGFYWGYLNLINGMIKKIMKDQRYKPFLILTGGLSNVFKSRLIMKSYYDPNLTLKGLQIIGMKKYE